MAGRAPGRLAAAPNVYAVCVCVLGEFRAGPLSYTRVELRRARPYRAVVDTPERLAHAHWNVPSAKALLYAAYEGGAAGTGT